MAFQFCNICPQQFHVVSLAHCLQWVRSYIPLSALYLSVLFHSNTATLSYIPDNGANTVAFPGFWYHAFWITLWNRKKKALQPVQQSFTKHYTMYNVKLRVLALSVSERLDIRYLLLCRAQAMFAEIVACAG